jgi:hypothetical protein
MANQKQNITKKALYVCEILGSYSGVAEDKGLFG